MHPEALSQAGVSTTCQNRGKMGELDEDKCREQQWQMPTATKSRQGIHKSPSIIYPSRCQDRGEGGFCIDLAMVQELWAHSMFRGTQMIFPPLKVGTDLGGDLGVLFICPHNVLVPSWSACIIIVFYIEPYWTNMRRDVTADVRTYNQGLNPTVSLSKLWPCTTDSTLQRDYS